MAEAIKDTITSFSSWSGECQLLGNLPGESSHAAQPDRPCLCQTILRKPRAETPLEPATRLNQEEKTSPSLAWGRTGTSRFDGGGSSSSRETDGRCRRWRCLLIRGVIRLGRGQGKIRPIPAVRPPLPHRRKGTIRNHRIKPPTVLTIRCTFSPEKSFCQRRSELFSYRSREALFIPAMRCIFPFRVAIGSHLSTKHQIYLHCTDWTVR